MKNKEFYKEKIFEAVCKYKNLAVDNMTGAPCSCYNHLCERCKFFHWDKDRTCVQAWNDWLEQEHVEPVLTDKEKRYLENVIKPFRDRIEFVQKNGLSEDHTFIRICVYHYNDIEIVEWISLPYFDGAEMYIGMKDGKSYTTEELGLFMDKVEDNEK